jgi:putative endonuclease
MYILECSDGSYYTGSTWNLEKRLYEHQKGLGANHTAKRLPVKLIYCEECDRIEDAFQREKQVQGWSRRKKKALMAGDSNMLHQLAECRNETHHGFDCAQPPHDYAQPPQNYDKTPHGFTQSLEPPRSLSGAKVEARHVLDVHREEDGE